MTFSVKVSGFNTFEEAEEFINWFSNSGEQDAAYSFEANHEMSKSPVYSDMNVIDDKTLRMQISMVSIT